MEPSDTPEPAEAARSDEQLLATCDVERFRSSGPGGQHANRRETAVRLRHRPSGIVVTCQDERSQRRNLQIALRRLRVELARRAPAAPRVPTSVPHREHARRRVAKQRRSLRKRLRRRPDPETDSPI